jgi:4-amino-4-deoxy-L-arabinose transferase-like glycosyltransferase
MASAGLSLPLRRRLDWRPLRVVATTLPPVLVVGLAAGLRLSGLAHVADNPFYDAAVRSMSLSWHNFFYGAFDPSAQLAVDKPPIDLWLQVASVKLFGFTPTALKLPQALAGTASVALLYDLVRRGFGRTAGLVAALALAVLPVSVLTARSDTMDSVMSALMLAALWLAYVGATKRRAGLLYLAAVAVGLAFNVKLFEALIVVPGLVALYAVACPERFARRVEHLVVAGVLIVLVSLSWATAVSVSPGPRPYPIGSTDGTVWNAMFVWDGLNRLNGKPHRAKPARHHQRSHHRLSHHRAQVLARRARHADAPGPIRLLRTSGRDAAQAIGTELLPAMVFGALALVLALLAWLARRRGTAPRSAAGLATGFALWLVVGAALFSAAKALHIRYLEAFAPAVAAVLGIGVVASLRAVRTSVPAAVAFAAALFGSALYVASTVSGALATVTLLCAAGGVLAAVLVPLWRRASVGLAVAALAASVVALFAAPLSQSLSLVSAHRSDSGTPGRLPAVETARLSAFLQRHAGHRRFAFTSPFPSTAAPLIVRDALRPLVLLRLDTRPLVTAATLKRLVANGDLRYAFLDRPCHRRRHRHDATSTSVAPTKWICTHGHDVGRRAGLHQRGILMRLRA